MQCKVCYVSLRAYLGWHLNLWRKTSFYRNFFLPQYIFIPISFCRNIARKISCVRNGSYRETKTVTLFSLNREQRVTHVLIFVTIGMSTLMTPLLSHIPMPVLYGVFLYMGVASLNGLQFFDRILLVRKKNGFNPEPIR